MKSKPQECLKPVLLTSVVVVSLMALQLLSIRQKNHRVFDQRSWFLAGQLLCSDTVDVGIPGTDDIRQSMVEDVMAHHLHVGMSRAQVLALLGPPESDDVEWSVPANVPLPDSLNYALMSNEAALKQSPESYNRWFAQYSQPDTLMRYRVGWNMDPISMRIEFSGKERVRRFWVAYH